MSMRALLEETNSEIYDIEITMKKKHLIHLDNYPLG